MPTFGRPGPLPTPTSATSPAPADPGESELDIIPRASDNPADADRIIEWVKRRVYANSPLYADDFSTFRKAELYDRGAQWLQKARGTSDAAFATQWKEIEAVDPDGNVVPLPVYNEGVLVRENESARLGRPEYKPRVRPSGDNPGIKERDGARGGERALQDRLRKMFGDEEDKMYLHQPLYGGFWLKSYWDQDWLTTVRVPVGALVCPLNPKAAAVGSPAAGLQSSPSPSPAAPTAALPGAGPSPIPPALAPASAPVEVPPAQVPPVDAGPGAMPAGMAGAPPPGMAAMAATGLPAPPPTCDFITKAEGQPPGMTCPYHPDLPLQPYQPTLAEAASASSDLGKDVPKGDWFLRVPTPYHIFPMDAGVGVDPTDIPEWVERYVWPFSEVEKRWPDKVRDMETGLLRVHPQNPATAMADDPTLGAPTVLAHVAQAGVFRSHVIMYEYHRKPWLEWRQGPVVNGRPSPGRYEKNEGRSIFIAIGAGGQGVICFDGPLMIQSLNKPGDSVERVFLQFVAWERVDGGRRSTVGASMWSRLFDPQDGVNERSAQTRAVNQRGANPVYLEARGKVFETLPMDSAVPFRRIQVDIDPNDRQPPLQLLNNETINQGAYAEIEFNLAYIRRNQVEVEAGQVPPGVAAATAIAYLKTEAGEPRRPRILRIRRALPRAWDHGLRLMSALYIEPREYSYEDEDGDERQAFISGDVIAKANPRVDIYPTPDYDVTDARRETIRDLVQLGVIDPKATPELSRKIVNTMDETLSFFLDDDHQEEQAQREWRDFKDRGRVPVTDPSLDDDRRHYQCHGRECFSEWFRGAEDAGRWDDALRVIGGDWDKILEVVVQMALMPPPAPMPVVPGQPPLPAPPRPAIQDMIQVAWVSKLQQAGFQVNDALKTVVIPWRAHMEAHRAKDMVKQMREAMKLASSAAAAAPGGGSAPESTKEGDGAPGGGAAAAGGGAGAGGPRRQGNVGAGNGEGNPPRPGEPAPRPPQTPV